MKHAHLTHRSRTKLVGGLALATLILTATGCVGSSGSAGEDAGEALPVDATKEEFVAALEDMNPVRLTIPETATEGSPGAMKSEYYKEAVEKWSGGKITIEIGYGGSFASAPEVESALQDGRVQVGFFYPSMSPDSYPELTKVMSVSNQGAITPLTGLLQGVGALSEYTWSDDAVIDEIEGSGVVPLIPAVPQSPTQGLACKSGPVTSLEEASGRQVRISNGPARGQLEAIGTVPVSITTAELYEGIQRDIVDCNTASIYGSDILGLFDLTKHFSTGDEISFVSTIGTLGVNPDTWESLPLPARQLLYFKTDAFIEGYIRMMLQTDSDGVETLNESGGEVSYWGDSVTQALERQRDASIATLEKSGDADLVSGVADSFEAWGSTIEDLGYEDRGTLADLPEWYSDDELDLTTYIDHYRENVLAPHLPGNDS